MDLHSISTSLLKTDLLILDEPDITPVPRGWDACLLGRFTGRYPGKEAIFDLMRRWKHKSRVTFHRKGWLCFQFGSEEAMEKIRQQGPFDIFGIPLVLQPMPKKFDPDMEPEVMVPIWLRLVDLPLELWNLTAVSKIASCFGTPLSTDFSTLRRESLDGPRIKVIIDTARRPKESLTIQLPNGDFVEQKVEYEFFPKFCNACKMYGHFADECRGRDEEWKQAHGTGSSHRSKSRGWETSVPRNRVQQPPKRIHLNQQPETGTPAIGALGAGPSGRSGPQERSRSRPQQQWKPTGTIYPMNMKSQRPRDKTLDD
ncbi:uncharacterized protein LOC121751967 [Salvia splendens]|uniref:uncharacterized protein LOC121751967 n=1 Tax=Salvia splendens TaxID=180675 RepID=UPI001C26B738|nr:uncharacterized protein LOC121751967 [Salvia splendens]